MFPGRVELPTFGFGGHHPGVTEPREKCLFYWDFRQIQLRSRRFYALQIFRGFPIFYKSSVTESVTEWPALHDCSLIVLPAFGRKRLFVV